MTNLNVPVTETTWETFVTENRLDSNALPQLIADSWHRSHSLGVNPYSIDKDDFLTESGLKDKIQENNHFLTIAEPFVQDLYTLVRGTGFSVFLTDRNGYILYGLGDPNFASKSQKICLRAGANWDESARGTNAIGTAIATQRPVAITGRHHYCKVNHSIACAAAPIFNSDGQLLGVLDLTGDVRKAHPHTLATVVSAASFIENKILLLDTKQKIKLIGMQADAILEFSSDGFICVDRGLNITLMNQTGATILGVSREYCVGHPLNQILNIDESPWARVFDTQSRLENAVHSAAIKMDFTYDVHSMRNEEGSWMGALISLHKKNQYKQQALGLKSTTKFSFSNIIGTSSKMETVIKMAKTSSKLDSTILLQGETGTGKEVFAQSIHNASLRSKGPFVAINCGSLPKTLIESELFGYESGSFTGAKRSGQPGKFEQANGGTIFLDEIGEMPLDVQASLLRVLEERQVARIGGDRIVPIDIRVIAATNKDLALEVEKGNFRRDLFYRLNVLNIFIPPLRERDRDIIDLANYFLACIGTKINKVASGFSPEVEEVFMKYSWPGNVRELRNVIERALCMSETSVITIDALPQFVLEKTKCTCYPSEQNSEFNSDQISLNLREMEKQAISSALHKFNGNMSLVAQALGIGRNTLYHKMYEYGIEKPTKK